MADPSRDRSHNTAGNPGPTLDHVPAPAETISISTRAQDSQSTAAPRQVAAATTPNATNIPSIPGYVVTGEIARGGMGRVFAGRELALQREVAIKTLLPGANPARFVVESQITACLPHPGIPPVHALGSLEDGTPYLAMKLIRGQTLHELLKARPSPQHEQSRFLQIFEQIAQAVGFAHVQQIIHRDLKPLNVMVGSFGEVQVMDWGLAKEVSASPSATPDNVAAPASASGIHLSAAGFSDSGSVVGTPGYMSPEQARGELVDARADVFALGSILAAILTGKPAFVGATSKEVLAKAAAADLAEVIQRLDTGVADVELLALAKRCLSVSPHERPENAQAVAQEIAAYRANVEQRLRRAETQAAEAQVREAEGRKRRNVWIGFAATLFVGLIVSTLLAYAANESRKDANFAKAQTEKRLAQVERGSELINSIFLDLDIHEVRASAEPLEAVLAKRLIKAADELQGESIGDPLTVALLQNRLGQTLIYLGHPEPARRLIQQSYDTTLKLLGPDHKNTLAALNNLAAANHAAGNPQQGLKLSQGLRERTTTQLDPGSSESTLSLINLAMGYSQAGKYAQAQELLEQALTSAKAKLGPGHPDTLFVAINLGSCYLQLGKEDLALPLLEETVQLCKANLGADHPRTLAGMNNLARVYQAVDQTAKALSLFEETLKLRKQKLGADHEDTLESLVNLASCYQDSGRLHLALSMMEETLQLQKAKFGLEHPNTLSTMNSLAVAYKVAGKLEPAAELFEQTLTAVRAKLGRDHPHTVITLGNLAETYRAAKKPELAVPLYEEVLAAQKQALGPEHHTTLSTMKLLGETYAAADRYDLAWPLYEQALELMTKQLGPEHLMTLETMGNSGGALARAKQGAKAAPRLQAFVKIMQRRLKSPRQFASLLSAVGADLLYCEQYAAAEPLLREALDTREKEEADKWTTFETQSLLGEALLGQQKADEAELLLLLGYEGLKERAAAIPPGIDSPIAAALDRLVKLYTALDKPAELQKWQAERAKFAK